MIASALAMVLAATPPILVSEFVYDAAPFPSAHASTIVETGEGLVAAWFGGTAEGRPDVGIWVSRRTDRWSPPVEVATGAQPDGTRHPCWNPVLFQPARGPLLLFYKVGPSPREWWGEVRTSADGGRSWSPAAKLPPGILGPIRAKPIAMPDGSLLAGSSTEHAGWVVHMERLADGAWTATGPLNDPAQLEAIQPTILAHSERRLQILCRTRQGAIAEAWSEDGGRSWSPMKPTSLPNPSAGIDAVRLADGRFLLVYNPSARSREELALAVSADGRTWRRAALLEDAPGEHSYPAMIQGRDGRVHLTYTWRRQRIKHVVLDPARIE
jgi:predicted neuraminidase